MKITDNFHLEEFVPERVFSQYGGKSIWFIDDKIVKLAQHIRDRFGKSMTINNWKNGGRFNYRGFRDDRYYFKWDDNLSAYKSKNKGKLSQHRFGRAIDFNISGMSADEVRADLLAREDYWMDMGLTTLEDGAFAPTWIHADIRETNLDKILIVKP